jgi:hypothetical protein
MAEAGTAQPMGWRSWVREVARGWLLYALAITAVALAARARNIWLLAACSGVLAAAGIAFQGDLTRRGVRTRTRLIGAGVLVLVGIGTLVLWSVGGKTEGWGFIGLTTVLFGGFQLLSIWRDNRWKAPVRGPLLLLAGAALVTGGLVGLGPEGPGYTVWVVLAGIVVFVLGLMLVSEDFLRLLRARHRSRGAIALLGLGGILIVASTVPAYVRLGAPVGYGLLLAVGITVVVGSIASRSDADAIILVIALMVAWSLLPRSGGPLPFEPTGQRVLVALGDSYISGEGAKRFYEGTNTKGKNQCRRAPTAYAPALARAENPHGFDSLVFLACSGAKAVDIYENDQYPGEPLDDLIPPRDGGKGLSQLDQYDRLLAANPFRAGVVLVSIGGNDAGFSKLVTTCVGPGDCAETGQKWLDELPQVGAAVARAYAGIRERFPDVPVLTIPYPTPLNPEGCAGSLLSPKDHQFLHGFVTQLNLVLRHEAEKVRFHYMEDVRTSFERERLRLCDGPFDQVGVNFFGVNPVDGGFEHSASPQNWLHDSFHPNDIGHRALEKVISERIVSGSSLPALAPPDPRGAGPYITARLEDVMGDQALSHCASATNVSRFCHRDEDGAIDTARWARGQTLQLVRQNAIPLAGTIVGAWLLWMSVIGLWRRTTWWRRTKTKAWTGIESAVTRRPGSAHGVEDGGDVGG